jgi:hypothetical protein
MRQRDSNHRHSLPDLPPHRKREHIIFTRIQRKVCPDYGVLAKPALDRLPAPLYLTHMTLVLAQTIELQDRARLRERFYGAARTVLARL